MPEQEIEQPHRRSHVARFEDGPRDGQMTVVLALDTGQPPDILLTPGQPEWVYILAGGPRRDGSWPYLHMSPTKAALLRSRGRRGADQPGSST